MGSHAKVAFLGLGAMGLGMATSLLRAGFTVQGYDVSGTAFMCRGVCIGNFHEGNGPSFHKYW